MADSPLPITAFIHPFGNNHDQILALFTQASQWLVGHLAQAGTNAPLPDTPYDATTTIPVEPLAIETIFQQLDALVASSMNLANPRYIGHMDTIPSTLSIIGEMLSSGLNNNMLAREMSPALSQLEQQLTRQFAQLFGMADEAGGVLTSGGTLATLLALTVARNQRLNTKHSGLYGVGGAPILFTSAVAHTSVQKVGMILGLGLDGVIAVQTNAQSQMDVTDLRAKIAHARAQGQRPFAIVATAGTTVTGGVDPLRDLLAVARAENLWLHVDATYGGAVILSEQHAHLLDGIGEADSIAFNPQKWLYVAKTCAMALFQRPSDLLSEFRVGAPYMKAQSDINLGEIGVQGTRHTDVLKLWLTLQHIGKRGLAHLIERNMALTDYTYQRLRQHPAVHIVHPPQMNLLCLRLENDARTQALHAHLTQAGFFVSLPQYQGATWLRLVLLNPFTDEAIMDEFCQRIDEFLAK